MNPKDLRRLMTFVQVVNTGSFTAAAKRLDLPRSSVSQQIRALEKSVGIRLLQRTTRKLSLTSEGNQIFQYSNDIQGLINQIDTLSQREDTSGEITISVNIDIADLWLIPRVSEFRKTYPDIYIRMLGSDYASDLVEDQIDLAIRIAPTGTNFSLIGRKLYEEKTRLYASQCYIDENGMPGKLSDLQQHTWIMLKQLSPNGELELKSGAEQPYAFKPTKTHETDSPYVLKSMLERHYGIGVLLPSVAGNSNLIQILPQYYSINMQIALLYPSRQLPLRTRLLADFLLESGWITPG